MTCRNGRVVVSFVDDNTVWGSFLYLGKGVELGTMDRVICRYRLKNSKSYRAIYGDLTVKDVKPENLPLPVDS